MKTAALLIVFIGFMVAVFVLPARTKGPELHTYEVIYSGVDVDWQDRIITDTICVPQVQSVFLAKKVAGMDYGTISTGDNWLLIQYVDHANMDADRYVHSLQSDVNGVGAFLFDHVAIDNLVDSLISWREITPAQ